MIHLPNTTYVELYSEMAEAILLEHHFGEIDIYVTEENGDQRFTDEAQDLFMGYCELVEGVLESVGIGKGYDLAASEDDVHPLTEEYETWCSEQGFKCMDALELVHEYDLTPEQSAWIYDFIDRWLEEEKGASDERLL